LLSKQAVKRLCAKATKKQRLKHQRNVSKNLEILTVTENLQDSVEIDKEGSGSVTKGRNSSPNSKQGLKRTYPVGPLIAKDTQSQIKRKASFTIKEMFERASNKKNSVNVK
jgi:hypothetical protein